MCNLISVCVVVTVLVIQHSRASHISLTASPSIINPGITKNLTLRCSITNSSTSSQNGIIGRREISDIIHPHLTRLTEAPIAHITSIVIIRQDHVTGANDTIASVTTFEPATAHTDLDRISVSGITESKALEEQGYLELSWSNPTARQYGVYTCEVYALNSGNRPEEILQSVQVGINRPTTQELLLYVGDLERRTHILENRLAQIQGGNVQTDTITCSQGTNDYHIVFTSPFNKIPTVITALAGAQNGEAFVYSPIVINLTAADFTLRCSSYQQTNVVWVAL